MVKNDLPAPGTTNKIADRPKTRQRIYKAPPVLDIPNINHDAAERKRVLNVLAQRRYRERRRQSRKADLEVRRESACQEADACDSHQPSNTETDGPGEATVIPDDSLATGNGEHDVTVSWDTGALNASDSPILHETGASTGASIDDTYILEGAPLFGPEDTSVRGPSSIQSLRTVDPRVLFGSSSPSASSTTPIDNSFPYSYILPVTELNLFRAFLRIAGRLGCQNNLWDINADSPFRNPVSPIAHLPQTWQPTTAQILIPHHPILDLLPWPSVRENIIRVFTLPREVRPPIAQPAAALVQFVYDLKDTADGIRVWGGDIYDPASWEVGQLLFERWWFIFNREVVAQSDLWRELRGAARLRITRPDEASR